MTISRVSGVSAATAGAAASVALGGEALAAAMEAVTLDMAAPTNAATIACRSVSEIGHGVEASASSCEGEGEGEGEREGDADRDADPECRKPDGAASESRTCQCASQSSE